MVYLQSPWSNICVTAVDAQFPEDRGDPDTDLGADQCAIVEFVEQRYLNQDQLDDLDVLFSAEDVVNDLIDCSTIAKGTASPTLIIKGELTDGTPFQSPGQDDDGIDQLFIQKK